MESVDHDPIQGVKLSDTEYGAPEGIARAMTLPDERVHIRAVSGPLQKYLISSSEFHPIRVFEIAA